VNGVQALLEAGADPNKPIGKEYSSVLYIAVGRDDPGVLKALLNAGADPNVYDLKSERTGLTEALSRGIHTNDWRHWEMLLEKADINRPYNKLGKTIAIYAANFNQFQRVVQLLEKGYSYRLRTLGRAVEIAMPLDEPSATWKNKTIEMLQDRGVDFPIGPVPPEVIFEGDLQMLPPSLR
jgi:ankyrin repeat protein